MALNFDVKRVPKKRLQLLHDVYVHSHRFNDIHYAGDMISISNSTIKIPSGFSWDGCTLARDGKRDYSGIPVSWKASAVHDAGYSEPNCPLSRKMLDLIFYDLLKEAKFTFVFNIPGARLYYWGVRILGWYAFSRKRKL